MYNDSYSKFAINFTAHKLTRDSNTISGVLSLSISQGD